MRLSPMWLASWLRSRGHYESQNKRPKDGDIGAHSSYVPIIGNDALLALVGLLLGLMAIVITPKEEEPQIDVTFADVYIPFPGASPREVESLVTNPAEQIVSEINGIDKIYSFSQPGGAMIVAIFEVGIPRSEAVVKIYNKLYSNNDWMP